MSNFVVVSSGVHPKRVVLLNLTRCFQRYAIFRHGLSTLGQCNTWQRGGMLLDNNW